METSITTSALNLATEGDTIAPQLHNWLKTVNTFMTMYLLPVIILSGMIGNLLAFLVFLCSPLRRFTISVYLAALSLTDFVFLVFVGLGWLYNVQINIFSLVGLCQIMVYVTYVVSFLSLWLIVAFTAEIYFSMHCMYLHKKLSRPRRAVEVVAILLLVACSMYIFSFWLTNVVQIGDGKTACDFKGNDSSAMATLMMDALFTLIFPFCLLCYMNVRILYTVMSVSKLRRTTADPVYRRDPATRRTAPKKGGNLLAKLQRMGANAMERSKYSFYESSKTSLKSDNALEHNTENKSIELTTIMEPIEHFPSKISKVDYEIHTDQGWRQMPKQQRVKTTEFVKRHTFSSGGQGQAVSQDLPRPHLAACTDSSKITPCRIDPGLQETDLKTSRKSTMSADRRSRRRRPLPSHFSRQSISDDRIHYIQSPCMEAAMDELSHGSRTPNDLLFRSNHRVRDFKKKGRKQPLAKLQRKCVKMVVAVTLVFIVLNLPSHAIKLQALLRSVFDQTYKTSVTEFHLHNFFQTCYYFNSVANFIIYSVCAKSFRSALIKLPYHILNSVRSLFRQCKRTERISKWKQRQCLRANPENSCFVEICSPQVRLSKLPAFAPNYKHASPPCLLRLSSSQEMAHEEKKPVQIETV